MYASHLQRKRAPDSDPVHLNEGVNEAASELMNGTIRWDLQSSDALTVSYGVYLYHVEAPMLG